jgi:molybdate transport system substrate-binding protein
MPTNEFRVMTSGGFTAAYKLLIPDIERLTKMLVVTVTTSIGTGDTSIPNRLKRGEIADIVICSNNLLQQFIKDGLVRDAGHAKLATSLVGFAVRTGAPKPDVSSADALRDTLLKAKSIGYSASESGKYVTTQLYQRLGIADQALPKSVFVGGGQRVGTLIARGEVEVGFQQISELLPVPGIDHITPLPPDLQLVSTFSAGVGANSPNKPVAESVIRFLASPDASAAIRSTGLEPLAT